MMISTCFGCWQNMHAAYAFRHTAVLSQMKQHLTCDLTICCWIAPFYSKKNI